MAMNFYGSRYQRNAELDRSMDLTVQTLLFAHRKVVPHTDAILCLERGSKGRGPVLTHPGTAPR